MSLHRAHAGRISDRRVRSDAATLQEQNNASKIEGTAKGAAKSMYDSMSKKELHEFADTETKDKPRHIGGKH
jgi:hypothetical protein